ncbi:MAG: galactokinase [Clostridiales bacterium]|nr:galactokinase [Clostridiales bacterium]
MVTQLIQNFIRTFGDGGDIRKYFAPGRVNMIGEHTDYNGGHVFPCALTIGTYAIVRRRDDRKIRFYSQNFEELGIVEGSLDYLVYEKEADWTNYPLGVIAAFLEHGYTVDCGMDILLFGNIPNSSGLSSSSSVEVVIGVMLRDMFGFEDVTMTDIALYGQYCENHFIGVNCGIMDQFSIAMGRKDQAIFLDCSDLSYTYVPLELKDAKIVIACSNKKRGLGDSKYNERRAECEEAVAELRERLDIRTLGELTEEEFEANKSLIKSEVRQRRAKHAVYENQRTLKAVEVLQKGDLEEFGRLMNASHVSLRDDYEVTGIELDTLVETAWEQDGVIGSRMTGAGFGGCTVSIVKEECVDAFIENVGKVYLDKIGYAADFYVVEIGDGGRVLQ